MLQQLVTVTEANLTSNNIFIDTTKPVITLNGNANTTIERYDTYTDAGATITDEDPKYNGTVSSNASSINTDTIGSYLIEYHAPADLAGNIPDNVTRMVTIQDTKHPTITALNITTNNPSGTHVAANQKLTITLETNEILTGTNATILNQAITMNVSGTSASASVTVPENHPANNATFNIAARNSRCWSSSLHGLIQDCGICACRISFVSNVMVIFGLLQRASEGLFVVMFSAVMVGCFVSCIVTILP